MYLIVLLCFSFVSCSTLTQNYIDKTLYQANSFANTNQETQAIDKYDEILKIEPTNSKALYNKAVILYKLGQSQDAIDNLNLIITNDLNNKKAYQLKIQILKADNNLIKTVETYNTYINQFPTMSDIRVDFVKYLIDNFDISNTLITSNLLENSNYLLNNNISLNLAAKALCLIDKENIEYSMLLFSVDKKTWEEIYSPSL
jgi:tetratricopeptide (TPR) repeat protein